MKHDTAFPARVLLVDDNQFGISARKMILETAGYSVETALSGEEAWEIFQKIQFDVVVTDYRMGGMNGVDLIALMRKSGSAARIILLSGFAGCLGLTEENSGADEVLVKSNTEAQELLRSVRKHAQPLRKGPSSHRARKQVERAGA